MNDKELKILHLSDLHFGFFGPKYGDSSVMKKYWEIINRKIEEYSKIEDIRPNIILITGDISSLCSPKEFKEAIKFIKQNLNQFLKNKLIVLIPGNHDLKWIKTEGRANKNRFKNYFDFIKTDLELIPNNVIYDQYLEKSHFLKKIDNFSTLIIK